MAERYKLAPPEAPKALMGMLTMYDSVDGMDARDRQVILDRLRERWAVILDALPEAPPPEREQQLEHALSLIVTANHAMTMLRRQHGKKAAEDTRRSAVRQFNLAIENARNLLAERRTPGVSVLDHQTFSQQTPMGGGETK